MEREVHYNRHRADGDDNSPTPAERQRAVLDRLEAAVGAICDSESFRRYLDAQARFHTYSFGNVALILAQRPESTRVAGYRTWQSLGRQVRRGETGIKIIVPMPGKTAREDEETGEETTVVSLRFGIGTVFDVSQTEGEPLPQLEVPVLEDDAGGELYAALGTLAQAEGITLDCRPALSHPEMMGFYEPATKRIVLRQAPQLQMTKTLAHELAHHFTGMHETYSEKREAHETTAEAVAYVVLAHHGLDSGTRSFPYIATWAKDTATLKGALGTIQAVAGIIISRIDEQSSLRLPEPVIGPHDVAQFQAPANQRRLF
jgi:antirestriction protein ArdC